MPFDDRADREHVEALGQLERIGPEAGEEHVPLEMLVVDLPLERLAQFAVADDHEPRVGHLAHDERRRLDQVVVALVRHQRRHVADDRRVRRQVELAAWTFAAGMRTMRSTSTPSCTIVILARGMPSATSRSRMATLLAMKQSTCEYFQRENELCAIGDSIRRDARSGGFGVGESDRQRGGGHRDGVRVVRVNHVGRQLLEDARQPPGGREVDLAARRERDQVVALAHPPQQLAFGMRDERRAMAERAQSQHGVQHLALAAPPAARRVYVKGEHRQRPRPNSQLPKVPGHGGYSLGVGSWDLGVL